MKIIDRRAYWDDEAGDDPRFLPLELKGLTVMAEDDAPEKTGLLDQHGNPIYRVREHIKAGFVP